MERKMKRRRREDENIEVKSTPLSPGFVLSVIKITNTTVSDFALYHCRAANSLGVSRSFLMLHDGSGKSQGVKMREGR
ncbi:hypothetical protein E2C01_069942 [Portunus trituberculatus]|uniref:Immunoglobulin I-set domain-containing protein n=1 Tax=Portunus trituberculatus TaxID=210409 RepID=A0A5B7HVW1_PORTR|nr:hypothetical protein [Portunus trituberculatus]